MTNHYELLYLVAANYTEDELGPIKNKVKESITKFKGEITFEDSLGKKKLAYPIAKNHQGYYLLYEFDLDGNELKKLDKELKLTNEILRHIIVKKALKTKTLLKTTEEKLDKKLESRPIKPEVKTEEKEKKSETGSRDRDKIKLEDLDQRLDEILDGDIM